MTKIINHYKFCSKLYHYLNNNTIHLDRLNSIVGYYDPSNGEITLDYRYEIVNTLIHEFIHHLYPKMSETKVLQEEKRMMKSLSKCQIKRILNLISVD